MLRLRALPKAKADGIVVLVRDFETCFDRAADGRAGGTERETVPNSNRIAAIPGDGIGKEVIPAGLEVLELLLARRDGGFRLDVTS